MKQPIDRPFPQETPFVRRLAAVFLLANPFLLAAQPCIWQPLPFAPGQWAYASQYPGDGLLVSSVLDYVTGDIVVSRFDASNNAVWQRMLMALDPAVYLNTGMVKALPGGGVLAGGMRYNHGTTTTNDYLVALDASGNTTWARMYSTKDSVYHYHYMADAEPTPDGGCLVLLGGMNVQIAKLDATGVPQWCLKADSVYTEFYSNYMHITPLANGDLAIALSLNSGFGLMRVDQNGNVSWSKKYLLPGQSHAAFEATELTDGSLVVAVSDGMQASFLVKVDALGDVLSAREFLGWGVVQRVTELTNGQLFATTDLTQGTAVMQLAADFSPIASWQSSSTEMVSSFLPTVDDTLRMAIAPLPWGGGTDPIGRLKVAPPYDFSCYMTPQALPSNTMAIATQNGTFGFTIDSVKTWTMALVEADPNACDVVAWAGTAWPRPGFTVGHWFTATNLGGLTTSPLEVTATLDPLYTITSIWPTPTTVAGNVVTWSATPELDGLSTTGFHILATLPPDPNLLGTQVTTTITVQQDSLETTLANNSSSITRTIVGAYDPNDKLVFPKDVYHITNDSILDYTIRFQNTGTDTAFTVVIVDTLPAGLDVLTFQPGAASHPYTYSLTGEGLLKFTFSNILLPDSNTNEPLSHGLVNFRIKPIQPIYLGQTITNVADIYFDFNPPVRTPPATVIVTDLLAVKPAARANELTIYPVPVRDVLTAILPKGFLPRNAMIASVDGQVIWSSGVTGAREQVTVPVERLTAGTYTITVLSMDGERCSARFVKE